MKPIILHISNDYPDHLSGTEKTTAISDLVDATPQYRHIVYSLNRTNGWSGIASMPFGEDRVSIIYKALPKGIMWRRSLEEVAAWIINDLKSKNIVPDVVQAHKLTVEGIVGLAVAKAFVRPLVCEIQGNTDCMLLNRKPALHGLYKEIAQYSSVIFPYAPWTIKPFADTICLDPEKCAVLPVLPGFDALRPSAPSSTPRLVTLLRMRGRKSRSVFNLLEAVKILGTKYPDLTLDIFGGGMTKRVLKTSEAIDRLDLRDSVFMKGKIANNLLPETLGGYSALVMPSLFETYGLVYAEALFCGVPVLYSKGRGIEGYFNADDIGYACDPFSPEDIAKGIEHLLKNEADLKANIASMQKAGAFDGIRRAGVISSYTGNIDHVLAGKKAA